MDVPLTAPTFRTADSSDILVATATAALSLEKPATGAKPAARVREGTDTVAALQSRLLEETKAHAEADAAVANRDRLLAIFSHDLRNLLNALTSNAEVFLRVDGDRSLASAENIRHAVSRMDRLLSNLLDLARLNAGMLDITRGPFDMSDLVREAVALFRPLAESRSIDLELVGGNAPLPAMLDHDRIFQVLSNLLSNAVRYTPKHGKIRLAASRIGGEVQVSVENTGPPIPPEDLERIFEIYRRLDGLGRDGLGLGLYISRAIVLGHDGRMWATSRPEGNTFFFTVATAGDQPSER